MSVILGGFYKVIGAIPSTAYGTAELTVRKRQ